MIRTCFLVLLFLSFISTSAQEKDNAETLDHFFAGVPLKEDFVKWFNYIRDHPYLGIDSSKERGHYSSFKPGIKSYFPFPDSQHVKLLLKKTLFRDSLTNEVFDSVITVMIEGVFADNKAGRKKSREVFKEIRKNLRQHYKQQIASQYGWGSWFRKGKSNNFPDCSIWQGYEEQKRFYYVLISYDFPVRTERPWYLELVS
jgi:hypothetical protein